MKWTDQLYRAGALTPVEDLLSEKEREELIGDLYPIFVEDNTWDGKLITFPFNKSAPAGILLMNVGIGCQISLFTFNFSLSVFSG